jgi:DNA-binding NarL/FixJ family response regulator
LPELVIDHKHRQFVSPRPRLVIADDDAFVRAMLAAQLDQMFECVGTAADARTAVALVVAQRPDVVILDVNMPGGGAMHATREIRKQSPDTAIVVLSIDEVRGDMSELLKAGAMSYLRKGIDERTLSRKLAAAIEGHRRNLQSAKPGNNTV